MELHLTPPTAEALHQAIPAESDNDSDGSDCSEEWVDPAAAHANLTRLLESTKQECEGEQERAIKSAVRKAKREEAKRWEDELKATQLEQDRIRASVAVEVESAREKAYELVLQTAKSLLQTRGEDSNSTGPQWKKMLIQYVGQASADAMVRAREEASHAHSAALEEERERSAQAVADVTFDQKITRLVCNSKSSGRRALQSNTKACCVLWELAEVVRTPRGEKLLCPALCAEVVYCLERYLTALTRTPAPLARMDADEQFYGGSTFATELRLVYELFLRFVRSPRLDSAQIEIVSPSICQKLVARFASPFQGERILASHILQQVRLIHAVPNSS
jgi:hypothetical protein